VVGFVWTAAPNWHARLHAPQCALLFAKSTSQPSHGSMSQLWRSVSQAGTQAPFVQVFEVVPAGVAQTRPHIPQFISSVCMLTQTPPQNVWPVGH
jgi:hypothetical protein